jgi:acyl carrier protein
MDTIEDKVKKVIVENSNFSPDEVTRSALLVEDLGADSLDVVVIIMAVEDDFGQEITDDEAELMTSLGAICEFFETKDIK